MNRGAGLNAFSRNTKRNFQRVIEAPATDLDVTAAAASLATNQLSKWREEHQISPRPLLQGAAT